jgi:branched-subunit amino acid transport protein
MGDMDEKTVILTIAGMGLVTYLPRALPLLFLGRARRAGRPAPSILDVWLRHIPAAVLAAMVLPSLLLPGGEARSGAGNLYLWAALPTLWVAWKTRSLLGAVLAGVAVVALGRLLVP